MRQSRNRSGLDPKASAHLFITRSMAEKLHRNVPIELLIPTQKHLSHGPFAEFANDLELIEVLRW
jgi:hypothetical protein